MNIDIALILGLDGLSSGAVYLLAGLGLVLIFSVTRVVFVPFGDVVAFTALSLVALERGMVPATVWLVLVLVLGALIVEIGGRLRRGEHRGIGKALLTWGVLPVLPCLVALFTAGRELPQAVLAFTAVAVVLPIGPLIARIALQPIADASALVLLMASLALHFMLAGLGLVFFGPDGARTKQVFSGSLQLTEGLAVPTQVALIVGTAIVFAIIFFFASEHTRLGKALRATAVNRTGARLCGIRPARAAMLAYLSASVLAGVAGVLIGPVTTIYFDSGFLIGLKSLVAAIIGGFVSYPLTVAGALLVGLVESFSAFWNSALKDVWVFSMLIPALLLRSLLVGHSDHEEPEEADR